MNNADLITTDEHGNVDVLALVHAQQAAKCAARPVVEPLGQGPAHLTAAGDGFHPATPAVQRYGAAFVRATGRNAAEAESRLRRAFRPGIDDDLVAV